MYMSSPITAKLSRVGGEGCARAKEKRETLVAFDRGLHPSTLGIGTWELGLTNASAVDIAIPGYTLA